VKSLWYTELGLRSTKIRVLRDDIDIFKIASAFSITIGTVESN
jgi:hypothetical protein